MATAFSPPVADAGHVRAAQRGFRPTRAMWFYLAAVAALYASGMFLPAPEEAEARRLPPPDSITGTLWFGYRHAAALLAELLPYWLAGILTGAALPALLSWERLRAKLGSGGWRANLAAASAGAVVPICSCSVVPVLAGMLGAGVPLGPAMAFLVAAPMLNAQTAILTAGALGWTMAAARVAATFAIALAAGALLARWQARHGDPTRLLRLPALPGSAQSPAGACSRLPEDRAAAGRWSARLADVLRSAVRRFVELNGYLLLAVAVAGAIRALVPERWIAAAVGGSGFGSVLAATGLAVPVYVCTYAEVPTAAALVGMGMGPGATLAYLLGGPGLSAASLAMLSAVLRPRVIAAYAALSVAGCLCAGLIYNWLA